jgi:hypothetical protein
MWTGFTVFSACLPFKFVFYEGCGFVLPLHVGWSIQSADTEGNDVVYNVIWAGSFGGMSGWAWMSLAEG